jgi:UDP-N-acetylmuramate dehydrogenase
MQNIGAYGVEAGDLITEVISIDYQGNTSTLSRSECQFGYRDSVFKNDLKDNACIAYVMFELKRYNSESYIPNMKYGAIEHKVKELQEMRDER